MGSKKLGYWLVGGAVALMAYLYYQEQQGIDNGSVQPDMALSTSDFVFSPAGLAAAVGGWMIYTHRR